MRIRQIRPEFFTDPVTAHLSPEAQITYIGLWCVADDDGFLERDDDRLGVLLYPYMVRAVRLRRIARAFQALETSKRIVSYPDCACIRLPHLAEHQRIGGTKVYSVRDKHKVHTNPDKSGAVGRNVTLSNVTVAREASGADAPPRASLKDILGEFEQIVGKHDE